MVAERSPIKTGQVAGQLTEPLKRLLSVIKGSMGAKEIMAALDLKGRDNFLKLYLRPALDQNLIERTIPEKPKSRMQKYSLTGKGLDLLLRAC
jgi:ATP-dependent DNA helicase RecG